MASSVFRNFDEYGGGGNELNKPVGLDRDNKIDDGSFEREKSTTRITHTFTAKCQLSVKNNPMCGICFPQWISILRKRHHQIEWSAYWPRLLFISFMSILNSIMGLLDHLIYGRQIESVQINPRPVFILGHPRTGTTLLHSLLALDSEQFSYCSTFCAGFPSCFLWFESIGKILFRGVIDDTRPMDNVKLDFDLPQEDELATNVMSAGVSPYMPLFFMRQEPEFRPYYAFDMDGESDSNSSDEQLEPSAMAEARKAWTDSFMYLLRKLTVRDKNHQGSSDATLKTEKNERIRRLILKSPVHTARIALLNQLFPEAQFIYIHRNPYDVFRSAAHMADTTYWYTYMNTPSDDQITEFILRQYEILYDRYEQGRETLLHEATSVGHSTKRDNQRLVEVSYDDISRRPIETARKIYDQLGWKWTAGYQQRIESELIGDDFRCYKKNRHSSLDPSMKEVINKRWGPSFERFGYKKE
jgi:hypothetical protein